VRDGGRGFEKHRTQSPERAQHGGQRHGHQHRSKGSTEHDHGGGSQTSGPGAGPENTSLDEERREVLASVLGTLAGNPSDADEMAACRHLRKRLAATAGRPGRHAA
jgi:hypothetical protein